MLAVRRSPTRDAILNCNWQKPPADDNVPTDMDAALGPAPSPPGFLVPRHWEQPPSAFSEGDQVMSQSHFTLSFPLKSPADAKVLAAQLPPLMPGLFSVLDTIGTIYSSRFTILDEKT